MKFRKHFDYDVEAASRDAAVTIEGPSLTVQSHAEDADINVLMKRFGLTGKMPENPRVPMYGDFTGVTDYQSALNAVSEAYDGFMLLPADVRARFRNNPQELLDFVADDANIDEARELGLLKEKVHDTGNSGSGGGQPGTGPGGPSAKAGGAQPGDVAGQPAGAGGGSKPA